MEMLDKMSHGFWCICQWLRTIASQIILRAIKGTKSKKLLPGEPWVTPQSGWWIYMPGIMSHKIECIFLYPIFIGHCIPIKMILGAGHVEWKMKTSSPGEDKFHPEVCWYIKRCRGIMSHKIECIHLSSQILGRFVNCCTGVDYHFGASKREIKDALSGEFLCW